MDEETGVSCSLQCGLMVDKGSHVQFDDFLNLNQGFVDFRAALLKKAFEDDQSDSVWANNDVEDNIDLDDIEIEDVDIPDGVPNLQFTKQELKQC